jgi:hypothetical protein
MIINFVISHILDTDRFAQVFVVTVIDHYPPLSVANLTDFTVVRDVVTAEIVSLGSSSGKVGDSQDAAFDIIIIRSFFPARLRRDTAFFL